MSIIIGMLITAASNLIGKQCQLQAMKSTFRNRPSLWWSIAGMAFSGLAIAAFFYTILLIAITVSS